MNSSSSEKIRVSSFLENLQASGRYTFSFAELVSAVNRSDVALRASIRRLKVRGKLASPHQGFWIIVPPEYKSTGSPPASWFIDDLMKYLNHSYYVGLLSAAAIHGATHHTPQIFQVVTVAPLGVMNVGQIRVISYRKRDLSNIQTMQVKTVTGYMTVSTPEATIFDLIRYVHAVGHLSNIATILTELSEQLDPEKLVKAACYAASSEVQRVGYLLELVGESKIALPLEGLLRQRKPRAVCLRADRSYEKSSFNPTWRLYINENVEPEV